MDVKFHIKVSPHRVKLSRKDAPGWMREHFRVGVKVKNLKSGVEEFFSGDELKDFVDSVKGFGFLRKYFPRNYFDTILR